MSLRRGYTEDGMRYNIYYDSGDKHLKVELSDSKKEIWVSPEEVEKNEVGFLASQVSFSLENDGSWVIRGAKAVRDLVPGAIIQVPPKLPYGKWNLVLDRAVPLVVRIGQPERPMKGPTTRRLPGRPPKERPKERPKLPKPKGYGLGNPGRRRLRVLFESTLRSLGVKVTTDMKVKAEEVIFQLDTKLKAVPREEAVEEAINDFLKWVEKTYYLKS